jgi:uncharacterized Zn finger protein (UPF0148 family)
VIYLCPNCGHNLPNGLQDGIAYCGNCGHSLETDQFNKLMSAAWMVIRQKPDEMSRIQKGVNLTEAEAILVEGFMINSCYSIDEFRSALKEFGIKK